MRVRAPGASRRDGEVLAQSLTERLANLPAGAEHIGRMRLRIQAGQEMNTAAMSDAIVRAIAAKLTRHQGDSHA
jgi:hypothetical protein